MSERKPLIAGNWKMNKGGADGGELAHAIAKTAAAYPQVDVVVAPPFTAIAAVAQIADELGGKLGIAGQNLYPKDSGAFTGEISASMLLAAGCQWVLVGHSERRQLFGETDQQVIEKTKAALAAGLFPIVCVGETLAEREKHLTLDVVYRQVDAVLGELEAHAGKVVIAYEPVWAIGTGRVAGPEQAQEVHHAIRSRLSRSPQRVAELTRILYGGSVKADNAEGLLGCVDVDGALVGGASLKADDFSGIIAAAAAL
jgi:triosephosphate isomerase